MFNSTPIHNSVINRDDPPKLINGSVNPLVGRTPTATPILVKACMPTNKVNPMARCVPYKSLACDAMTNPRQINMPNSRMIPSVPIIPNSSPITEKMKSVCASGK